MLLKPCESISHFALVCFVGAGKLQEMIAISSNHLSVDLFLNFNLKVKLIMKFYNSNTARYFSDSVSNEFTTGYHCYMVTAVAMVDTLVAHGYAIVTNHVRDFISIFDECCALLLN